MKFLQNQKLYNSMCDLAHNWIANHTHSYDKIVNTCHKNVSNQAPNYETNGDFRIKMKNCHIYLLVFIYFIYFFILKLLQIHRMFQSQYKEILSQLSPVVTSYVTQCNIQPGPWGHRCHSHTVPLRSSHGLHSRPLPPPSSQSCPSTVTI